MRPSDVTRPARHAAPDQATLGRPASTGNGLPPESRRCSASSPHLTQPRGSRSTPPLPRRINTFLISFPFASPHQSALRSNPFPPPQIIPKPYSPPRRPPTAAARPPTAAARPPLGGREGGREGWMRRSWAGGGGRSATWPSSSASSARTPATSASATSGERPPPRSAPCLSLLCSGSLPRESAPRRWPAVRAESSR